MSINTKVELTDEEWMQLIDKDREGLQSCCGAISELRDEIIMMARDGGRTLFSSYSFLRAYRAAHDGHGLRGMPVLDKVVDQVLDSVGMTYEELMEIPHRDIYHKVDELTNEDNELLQIKKQLLALADRIA